MKIKIIIALILLVLVSFGLYSIYVYRNNPVNQVRDKSWQEITDWLLEAESINQNKEGYKSQKDKDESIKWRKVVDQLNDDWSFLSEDWQIYEVNKQLFLIEYNHIFENLKTEDKKFYKNLYYYDLSLSMPIPLKSSVTNIKNNEYSSENEKTLWDGDFDSYCAKPKDVGVSGEGYINY